MHEDHGIIDKLKQQAVKAAAHSYSPYSQFPVGAAVVSLTGRIYSGCNVENASFGLTQCAERAALAAAISDGVTPGSLRKIFRKARKGLLKFGLIEDRAQFADYKRWIRDPKASAFFESLLAPPDALYREYTNEDYNKKYLQPHLAGRRDCREELGRAATVEIWLRRVFGQNDR